MRALAAFSLFLAVPVLAGCLAQEQPSVPDARDLVALVPIPAFPIEADHDHSLPAEHDALANLMAIGHASGYGDGAADKIPPGQGFSELFVRDGLAFLGRRGGQEGGFIVFDVKEPWAPKRLGDFAGLANYDMESTSDNKYVFFVSQYFPTEQPSAIPPDQPGEIPRSIHVVDVTDPKKPTEVSLFPVPTRGAHTITYHRTESGRELVAAQTYDFMPDPSLGLPVPQQGINPASQRVLLFDFVRAPAPHLELLSIYEKHPLMPTPNFFFPHDVAIQKHPNTNQLIMYVAYWNLGAFLVDITDPKSPKELSQLADFTPSKISQVHLAAPADALIDGRHVTVTEPEIGPADETGQYTLFDTTDPTKPTRLGYWTLPGQLKNDQGLRFSPHNFEVKGGRLVLAHYHAGVWLVDVSTQERLLAPETLGFIQPALSRPSYSGDVPNVWSAILDEGYIYASDIATGLHVFHYAGDPMAEGGMMGGHQHG